MPRWLCAGASTGDGRASHALLCRRTALLPHLPPSCAAPAAASGEGDFFFDEAEVMAGLDEPTRAALMAARMAGMGVDEDGELGVPGAVEEGDEDMEEDGGEELQALVGDDPSR